MEGQLTENEKKKEYLQGYECAVRQMRRHEERIREIRSAAMGKALVIDGMPRSHNKSDLSSYAALLDLEERKYMKARYLRIKKCREITDKIEMLTNEDEKDVLMYRYIKLMKWEDICEKMCVSWKQAHRIHTKALADFGRCREQTAFCVCSGGKQNS